MRAKLPILIDRRRPRTSQVYDSLKAAILEVRLKPGTPISENGICEQCGVSRTPVREALIKLAQEQLIDVFPQHGSFVSLISPEKVVEGHFVRQTLELAMLKRAAQSWSGVHSTVVANILALQRAHASTNQYSSFYREDERFHHYLAEAAGLHGVSRVISDANTHLARVRQLANPVKGHMAAAIKDHEAIVRALDTGREKEADAVLTRHLARVFETVQRLMVQSAEYFDDGRHLGYTSKEGDEFRALRKASSRRRA